MTTITSEADPAPEKSSGGGHGTTGSIVGLLVFILALLAVGSALFGGPVRDAIESRQEAEPWEYVDMSKTGEACPLLAGKAREAMADGRINNLEVRRVAEAMYAARDARDDAERKSSAYVAIGSAPLRLPPDCRSNNLFSTYETRRFVH